MGDISVQLPHSHMFARHNQHYFNTWAGSPYHRSYESQYEISSGQDYFHDHTAIPRQSGWVYSSQDGSSAPAVRAPSIDTPPYGYAYAEHYGPTTLSGSNTTSSGFDGGHDTPRSGSETGDFSPPVMYTSPVAYHVNGSGVLPAISGSMPDTPGYDEIAEEPIFGAIPVICQTGPPLQTYQHVASPYASDSGTADTETHSQDDDSDYEDGASRRARQATRRSSASTRQGKGRLGRRSGGLRNSIGQRSRVAGRRSQTDDCHDKPFHCPLAPYGCKSTFSSKNEWKRHFNTQHVRLGVWQCDQCPKTQGKKSNHFNRKDLFMQHVRRMHSKHGNSISARKNKGKQEKAEDDGEAIEAANRCHMRSRSPPSNSICVICQEQFHGASSWEKRMEHIGRHFEDVKRRLVTDDTALNVDGWHIDESTQDWMLQQGILCANDDDVLVVAEERKD